MSNEGLVSNESKEPRGLLSKHIEQELRMNPLITLAGVVEGVNSSIYLRRPFILNAQENVPHNKILTQNVDIYCGLKISTYDPEELQAALYGLTQTQPSEVKPFSIVNPRTLRSGQFGVHVNYDLDLGKNYYDDQLGTIVRSVRISIPSQVAGLLKSAGIILGELEDESELSISERTSLHLYPDENCAKWMYEYAKSPQDWKERKDWYDPGDGFFKNFIYRITAYQLEDLRAGKNIFWEEEQLGTRRN